ncbi:MAG: hypothetical protein P8188_09810 [Gemmatimonadota bacterium]
MSVDAHPPSGSGSLETRPHAVPAGWVEERFVADDDGVQAAPRPQTEDAQARRETMRIAP